MKVSLHHNFDLAFPERRNLYQPLQNQDPLHFLHDKGRFLAGGLIWLHASSAPC
jgi:hypothetical protein